MDTGGAELGRHDGSYAFTVGQRRGLRIGTPSPDGRPRYVLDIEPVSNTVTVGPAAALDVAGIEAQRPVWSGGPEPAEPIGCLVQLRAHGETYPATAWMDGAILRIALSQPARGVARGQAAVLYDGDTVLGSATISHTSRRSPSNAAPCPDGAGPGDDPGPRVPAAARLPIPFRRIRRRGWHRLRRVAMTVLNTKLSSVPDTAATPQFPWPAGCATGIGSMPGTDPAEVIAVILGELPDFPYLPELPARGPGADLTGRTAALLIDMPVEITAGRVEVR